MKVYMAIFAVIYIIVGLVFAFVIIKITENVEFDAYDTANEFLKQFIDEYSVLLFTLMSFWPFIAIFILFYIVAKMCAKIVFYKEIKNIKEREDESKDIH